MSTINIAGLDKAVLLAALYNHARPLGLGYLRANNKEMTKDEAERLLEDHRGHDGVVRFDYVHGRPLKVTFQGDELSGAWLYNRDQGHNACENIVDAVRSSTKS